MGALAKCVWTQKHSSILEFVFISLSHSFSFCPYFLLLVRACYEVCIDFAATPVTSPCILVPCSSGQCNMMVFTYIKLLSFSLWVLGFIDGCISVGFHYPIYWQISECLSKLMKLVIHKMLPLILSVRKSGIYLQGPLNRVVHEVISI